MRIVRELGGGRTLIRTPRYQAYTDLLVRLARRGRDVAEIAGNHRILVTVLAPKDPLPPVPGVTELFEAPIQSRPDRRRLGLDVSVEHLAAAIRALEASGASIEHIYDLPPLPRGEGRGEGSSTLRLMPPVRVAHLVAAPTHRHDPDDDHDHEHRAEDHGQGRIHAEERGRSSRSARGAGTRVDLRAGRRRPAAAAHRIRSEAAPVQSAVAAGCYRESAESRGLPAGAGGLLRARVHRGSPDREKAQTAGPGRFQQSSSYGSWCAPPWPARGAMEVPARLERKISHLWRPRPGRFRGAGNLSRVGVTRNPS